MKHIKTIICLLLVVVGFIILFGGEITVIAWCIYDVIGMFKAESVSFASCLYLIVVRVFGSLCLAAVGVLCIAAGFVGMGAIK